MIKLSKKQLKEKAGYINHYTSEGNSATKSEVDSNANVSTKNLATMKSELNKDVDVQVNRHILAERIKAMFGKKVMKDYYKSIARHEIYPADESAVMMPYCTAIDLYPFLSSGMTSLGGGSKAPKHLASFAGSYINLIFAISSQFSGAVAEVGFLTYFNYFASKDYGVDYLTTNRNEIENAFQHIIYSLNQPAAARGYQSVFYNTTIFDKYYFDSTFGKTLMPDGENPNWEQVKKLQEFFMTWFNKERTKDVLTFPVITAAYLTGDRKAKDVEFKEFLAQQMSEGNSFFHYASEDINSISMCCRLKCSIDKNVFSYSLGGTGVDTGSKRVVTLNVNRMVQDGRDVVLEIQKLHKYLVAYNEILHDLQKAKMLPVYDAGFIHLDKQFLTIGVNGVVEAAEYLGYTISNNKDYLEWVQTLLSTIMEENKKGSEYYTELTGHKVMFSTEFVPAENLGHKFAKWDLKDGYKANRDVYNSYLFKVEDSHLDYADKFKIHGRETLEYLDGGSALHLNLLDIPNKGTWLKIMDKATECGCNYWTFNTRGTVCNKCGHIDKHDNTTCVSCGTSDVDHLTRIIGYLKRITSFSSARQIEAGHRFYHKNT